MKTLLAVAGVLVLGAPLAAHPMTGSNATFVQSIQGPAVAPFLYLGAKHMVTGYDHLLFLVGVIFFLYRLKDVLLYVSLFTIGHSITLLGGVLGGIRADAHLVDAVIGASVAYKAFENLGGFERVLHVRPNTTIAVLISGSSTASAWPPSCRSSRSPPTGWSPTSSASTSASRSVRCWR